MSDDGFEVVEAMSCTVCGSVATLAQFQDEIRHEQMRVAICPACLRLAAGHVEDHDAMRALVAQGLPPGHAMALGHAELRARSMLTAEALEALNRGEGTAREVFVAVDVVRRTARRVEP